MKNVVIFSINLISKLFRLNNLRACRFYPTCSVYSTQAFQQCDFLKAFFLMMRRVLKCHPFSEGGYDPIENTERFKG